jgi:hypothetical protein
MEEVTKVTARPGRPHYIPAMNREPRAWLGLRCCRMTLRERALRWRRRQAQLRSARG